MTVSEERRVIKAIEGPEPHREGEYPWHLAVGCGGITAIVCRDAFRGDHSTVWYDVYVGDAVIKSVSERYIAEIHYRVDSDKAEEQFG